MPSMRSYSLNYRAVICPRRREVADHNFHRPHGGLNGQTPYERLRQKTTTTPAA